MPRYYSASKLGFFTDTLHPTLPTDAVAVADDTFKALMLAQQNGQRIIPDANGGPIAADQLPPPPPSLAQQAAALVAGGLHVTSTGTPGLSGVYSCDAVAISHVSSEMLSVLAGNVFADGTTSVTWVDAAGGMHTFPSVESWKPFALAIGAFVAAATKTQLGISMALPANTATIP